VYSFLALLFSYILFDSKNASAEGRVLVGEGRPDEVTRVRRLALETGNRRLDLRVVRHPSRRGFPRRAL